MNGLVVRTTFDADPDEAQMDFWEEALQKFGFESTVGRVPESHRVVISVFVPDELDLLKATRVGHEVAVDVAGLQPVGVETITEAELERQAERPTMPELMSAAEIAEELGVARQRVHQLRSTAAFPAPLAELRGGAVWDAAAVRKFAREWQRKPGRPAGRQPRRMTYRNSDGRMFDLDSLKEIGLSWLTKDQIDSMPAAEVDRIIAEAEGVARLS